MRQGALRTQNICFQQASASRRVRLRRGSYEAPTQRRAENMIFWDVGAHLIVSFRLKPSKRADDPQPPPPRKWGRGRGRGRERRRVIDFGIPILILIIGNTSDFPFLPGRISIHSRKPFCNRCFRKNYPPLNIKCQRGVEIHPIIWYYESATKHKPA